jgi:hypothetical protein
MNVHLRIVDDQGAGITTVTFTSDRWIKWTMTLEQGGVLADRLKPLGEHDDFFPVLVAFINEIEPLKVEQGFVSEVPNVH